MNAIHRRLSVLLAVAMLVGNVLLPAAGAAPVAASSSVASIAPTRASSAVSTSASRARTLRPGRRVAVTRGMRAAAIRPADSSGNPTFHTYQNPLDAGVQVTGTTTDSYLYIYNSASSASGASAPLTVTNVSVVAQQGDTAAGDYQIITSTNGGDCTSGVGVAPDNSSCYVKVAFMPSALGSRTAHLQVTDNAPDSPQTVAVSGTGALPIPRASLSPDPRDFGTIQVASGSFADSYVNIYNGGTSPLTITNIAVITGTGDAGGADFSLNNNSYPYYQACQVGQGLARQATCSVGVRFTPSTTGAHSAHLQVTDNAGGVNGAVQTVALSGAGTAAAPVANFDDGNSSYGLGFGDYPVGRSTTPGSSYVHVQNTGFLPLTINPIAIVAAASGDNAPSDFATIAGAYGAPYSNACVAGTTLNHNDSCYIYLTFKPSDLGSRQATLRVTDNAAGSPRSLTLTGNGVTPSETFSAQSGLDFGTVVLGTSATQVITLTNTGTQDIYFYNQPIQITERAGPASSAGAMAAAAARTAQGTNPARTTTTSQASVKGAASSPGARHANGVGGGGGAGGVDAHYNFAETNSCPSNSTLAVGASCAITVTFTPQGPGTYYATLADSSNASHGPDVIPLTGTATLNPADRLAFGWGYDGHGEIAVAGPNSSYSRPVLTQGISNAVSIAAGSYHSLAVAADGTVYAWGYNANGQLGAGTNQDSASALQIAGLTGVRAVAAGDYTSLALLRDGTARAWGNNSYGQLGNNTTSNSSTPVTVAGLTSTVALAAGSYHALALSGPLPPPTTGGAARLSADALAFGIQSVGVTSAARAITVTNTTGSSLSIAVSIAGGDYALTSDTCGTTLAAGASCALGVTFTPGARGPRAGALTVSDTTDGGQTVSLGGVGVLPKATFSTASVDFSEQQIDRTSPNNGYHVVQVTNNGQGALQFSSLAVVSATAGDNAPADFAVITNTNYYGYQPCPTSTGTAALAPGATCDIYLTFTPSITGTRQATLVATSNDPSTTPYSVTLTGTGIDPGATIAPASGVDFGPQLVYSTSATRTVTLTNTGSTGLEIFGLSLTNGSDFGQSNTCPIYTYYYNPQVLAPGASCVVSVTFTPQASGPRYGALTITDNLYNESSPQSYSVQTVPLTGTGAGPVVVLSGPTLSGSRPATGLNLGASAVGLAVSTVFTLTNSGDTTLHITAPISIAGPNAGDYAASSGCGATVAAGANCAITVTFRPSTNGVRTATLTLTDDAGDSPQGVALTGRGLFPAAARPLYAWGSDANGRLGTTVTPRCYYYYGCRPDTSTPVQVDAISGSLSVAAGSAHTLAVAPDHTVYAWGYNGYGQLGVGDTTDRSKAVQVAGPVDATQPLTGVVAVAAGAYHSLALTGDGHVYAWGRNSEGQLGTGDAAGHTTAVTVTVASGAPLTDVVSIAAGDYHSLAVTGDGHVYAWGDNDNGQLGAADTARRYTATPVVSPFDATQPMTGIAAVSGGNSFSLFLSNTGAVYGTGYNGYGQLGTGDTTRQTAPVTVTSLAGVAVQALAASDDNFSLALASDGTVYAWGLNNYGQLGTGDTTNSVRAHQVGGLSGVVAVAANGDHSMALLQDGTVRGWGNDYDGQLGDGTYPPYYNYYYYSYNATTPTTVTGLSNVVAIAAGDAHSVALSGTPSATGAGDITPAALAFGQQQVGTTSTVQIVTVGNTTGAPIGVTSVAVITDTADFTVTADGCTGRQLADSSASCTIGVVFAPGSRGARRGGLSITTSATNTPHIVSLGGIGAAPVATPDKGSIVFGDQQVGTTSGVQYVTLYNSGDAPLAIGSVTIDGPNSGDFAASATSCGATVAAGSSCYIGVTFARALKTRG